MKNTNVRFRRVAVLILSFLVLPGIALAYIEPATTSYMIQIVAGIVISLGAFVGVFWKRITMYFSNLKVKAMAKKIAKQAEKKAENQ